MNLTERLCEVIRESLLECDRCPQDSVRDIFNEKLEEWVTGLVMRPGYLIEVDGINAKASGVSEANLVNPIVETKKD